jgi:hypothetical protein
VLIDLQLIDLGCIEIGLAKVRLAGWIRVGSAVASTFGLIVDLIDALGSIALGRE